MAKIAYYRCSTRDQSIEHQRHALGGDFNREYQDEGLSGTIVAAKRPGFASLLAYMREGDTVYVTAIDRIGRDSIDIQTTYRDHFKAKGVRLYVAGLGFIEGEAGELILTLLAQFAQMERNRIVERTASGRTLARQTLSETGRTHRGKASLGRPSEHDGEAIIAWRAANNASIKQTADHFRVSISSVKRFGRTMGGDGATSG